MKATSILVMAWLVAYTVLVWIGASEMNDVGFYGIAIRQTLTMIFPFSIALIYYRFATGKKTKGGNGLKVYAIVMQVLTVLAMILEFGGIMADLRNVDVVDAGLSIVNFVAMICTYKMCSSIREYVSAYKFQQQMIEEADNENV